MRKEVDNAIKKAGGYYEVARAFGLRERAIYAWNRNGVPGKWVPRLEALSGVPGREFAPEIYPEQQSQ